MNFAESEAYLLSLGNEVLTMKLGLENIRKLLGALENPQNNYKKVQVAGTNGKGSVCAFLDAMCRDAGISTGVFTSPHLVSINERIKIDGSDISDADFARLATVVRSRSEKLAGKGELTSTPTFFEQVTAIALLAFAENDVDLAILETGLGGRLDATTAANAEICVITRIDYDHQEFLGNTLEEIAFEKAAIIRAGCTACVGLQHPDAMRVVTKRCAEVGVLPHTLESESWELQNHYATFNVGNFNYDEIAVSLAGRHQLENAALAILSAQQLRKYFPISNENIIHGLERAHHAGRLEWIEWKGMRVLLDGAHNPAGAVALANYLNEQELASHVVLVYGSMKGKDVESTLEILSPLAQDIVVTEAPSPRAIPANRLASANSLSSKKGSVLVIPDVKNALDSAVELPRTYADAGRSLVLVTGSLYLIGEVKRLLAKAAPT